MSKEPPAISPAAETLVAALTNESEATERAVRAPSKSAAPAMSKEAPAISPAAERFVPALT